MVEETFESYTIAAAPVRTARGRWSVSTVIKKMCGGEMKEETFYADDRIEYILEVEAAKECINLGKNLIKLNRVGF